MNDREPVPAVNAEVVPVAPALGTQGRGGLLLRLLHCAASRVYFRVDGRDQLFGRVDHVAHLGRALLQNRLTQFEEFDASTGCERQEDDAKQGQEPVTEFEMPQHGCRLGSLTAN